MRFSQGWNVLWNSDGDKYPFIRLWINSPLFFLGKQVLVLQSGVGRRSPQTDAFGRILTLLPLHIVHQGLHGSPSLSVLIPFLSHSPSATAGQQLLIDSADGRSQATDDWHLARARYTTSSPLTLPDIVCLWKQMLLLLSSPPPGALCSIVFQREGQEGRKRGEGPWTIFDHYYKTSSPQNQNPGNQHWREGPLTEGSRVNKKTF